MRIEFSGSCTVQRIEELAQSLRQALNGPSGTVDIHFSDVEEVDLSFFQLLHAFNRSAGTQGKEIVIRDVLPAGLTPKAVLCGFSEWTGRQRGLADVQGGNDRTGADQGHDPGMRSVGGKE